MFKKRKKESSLIGAVQNYYLICNTLLLLVFGICMLGISTRVLINKVEDSSEMITEQAVYTLDKTFNDIASQMVSFSSYRDLWNKFSKSNMSIQDKLDVNRELNNILKKTDLFNSVVQDILVISDNGYYFTTIGQDGLAANYDYWSKEWYQKAKDTTGNVYVHILGLHNQDFYSKRGNVHPNYVQDFCYGFLIQLNSDFVETLKKLRSNAVVDSFRSVDAAGVKNMFLRLMLSMRLDLPPKDVQMDEDVVRKIRHYIDTNYEKDISLTTLSKHFFISKYQISRLFKKQFEINYSDYILKVRMEAAEMMLRNSKEKIDDIAKRAGFEETSYFSRVFSKYFGMSPGEYRKKNM